ncbi:hypothetical protein JK358_26265 [Nocardia sp. 2]|uniref:DUF8020 domain-containing protein n=1 Tax=Nocardia acididurans TaxID=2802282 RepID=A0ABS1MB82_9NOCA|nr:hypothetical protein [Nocardia acididurans]MBL1077915.1 hypothetical protein [Nocardia acididurans]
MNTSFTMTRLACLGVAVTALGVAAADPHTARATEVAAAHDISNAIDYTAQIRGSSVVVHTAAGSLTVHNNLLQVLDRDGTLVSAVALNYQLGGLRYPIAAEIHGNEAVLTPGTQRAQAVPIASEADAVSATSIADPATENFDEAVQAADNEISLGIAVGSLIGTVLGAGVGCVAGAVVGAALMPPIFIPGAAGGCLAGIVAGAGLGVIAGTIAVGGPVVIASAVKFFTTIANPPAPAADPTAAA